MRTGSGTGARHALRAAVVASVLLGAWFLVFHVSPRPVWHHTFDLRVYRGAVRWWLDGRPVYDFVRPHTDKGFTYPPFAVLPLLPLALGTETTATVLLTAVSAALVVLTTWWLVAPVAVRHGWPRGTALAVALPVAAALEPVRETLGWGQIDLVIAALVLADLGALRSDRRWAGVGIGLATAIKVTPGLFLVYLAVTRRWRAAGVAAGVFGLSVLAGLAVDPSTRYWTGVLWQTGRVGPPTDPNDQSLRGLLARLVAPGAPGSVSWLALAGLALVVGMWRAALLFRRGDDLAGATVTGSTACLISPISWVHHLYWVVPAVVVLVDVAAGTPVTGTCGRRHPRVARAAAAVAGAVVVGIFASSLIWFFARTPGGPCRIVGEDAYVLVLVALVLLLPARQPVGADFTARSPSPGRRPGGSAASRTWRGPDRWRPVHRRSRGGRAVPGKRPGAPRRAGTVRGTAGYQKKSLTIPTASSFRTPTGGPNSGHRRSARPCAT